MPLYEYECDACGHRFEVIQKFADAPLEACEKCSGRVRKLLSSPAIQFKGSGWYITDYARAGKTDGASQKTGEGGAAASGESKTETKAEGTAASKGGAKTESKPEAKGDPKGDRKVTASQS